MEFEEACVILYAPEHVKAAITKEYKITRKEEKQAALSELKEAEEWLQERLKINGKDWQEMAANEKIYLDYTKACIQLSDKALEALKIAHKRSLTLKEVQNLANNMESIGVYQAARVYYKVTDEEHQEIIIKGNAIGTIKEKIDYIKAIHGVGKKGNLEIW